MPMADPADTALNPAASLATGSETENPEQQPVTIPTVKGPGDLREGEIKPNGTR
jgi:hypothetical protein